MSNENYYRHFLPSKISSTSVNYKTRYESSEKFNYKQTRNNLSQSWIATSRNNNPMDDSSRKLSFKSSSSNITKSQIKILNSNQRTDKISKRIDLLPQSKYQVESQTLTESITINDDNNGKINKINVKNLPSVSNRFRTITPRLLRLAQPKIYHSPVYNSHQCCSNNVKKMVVTKMRKRIDELAVPKKLQTPNNNNKDPFKINPKALKATCPSRIEELARPKGFSQPFSQLLQDYLDRAFIGP